MEQQPRRFLRVNLSTGKAKSEVIDQSTAGDFIGGRGFAISYLHRELAPNVDPLGEHNKLVLAAGPLAGTAAPIWMLPRFCSILVSSGILVISTRHFVVYFFFCS